MVLFASLKGWLLHFTLNLITHTVDLSIIIPAYNGCQILKDHLPVLLQWTAVWRCTVEVIVVVDGGDINEYRRALGSLPVSVVGYPNNKGKGHAIKHGFLHSSAPLILYTDADIPFSEKNLHDMYDLLQSNASDNVWVIGDRTLPGSTYFDHISPSRKAGSNLFLFIIKHTLGKNFADTQCGLKGFTRQAGKSVFMRSKIDRFAFDFESLYIASKLRMIVHKIPVHLRNQSPSSVRIYRDGWKVLTDVFKVICCHTYE